MKRIGNLYARIAEPENLRLAFLKAVRGKRGKAEVLAYAESLNANLEILRSQLLSGRLDVGHYHFFTVYDPKERIICAASFPERVLHHAIMNVCEPVLERYAIHDSYACRTGKGMHAAVLRAQSFARKYPWHLKLDIRKYFDSIDHQKLMDLLGRRIKDAEVLRAVGGILETYETDPGRGLPIGNLLSQHLANFYLGHLDHHVKEVFLTKGYVRYMDDFALFGATKDDLRGQLDDVRRFLRESLALELKDNVQLNRSSSGLPFLGYRIFPDRLALGPRARRRFSIRLCDYEQEWFTGGWSEAELSRHTEALLSYVRFADSLGFRKQTIARFSMIS